MTGRIAKTLFACTCLAGAIPTIPAFAQPAAQPSASGGGLEEIVVTARRREEKLQTVPVAVTAFSPKDLEQKSIESASDLAHYVPSLASSQQSRDEQVFYLRGQGPNGGQGGSPGVIAYFAEVPFNGSGPGIYYDLDSLQVLRGPQGTLFGQNTTGGAVLFGPKRPTNNFEGYVKLTAGSYDWYGVEGAVNIPIVNDKLLLRVAGNRVDRDGYTHDIGTGQDHDNRDLWSGRVGLTWRPTDDFENYLVYDVLYSHTHGTGIVPQAVNPDRDCKLGPDPNNDNLCLLQGSFARTFGVHRTESLIALQDQLGPRTIDTNTRGLDKTYSWGFTDIAQWDVTDDVKIKNIAGYRGLKNLLRYDFDGTRLIEGDFITPNGWNLNNDQYSDEIQVQGKLLDGKLNWIMGGFVEFLHPASYTTAQVQTTVFLFPGAPPGVATLDANAYGQNALGPEGETTRTQAGFIQGDYDFGGIDDALEGLKLTVGFRYTSEYRRNNNFSTVRVKVPGLGQIVLPCNGITGLACVDAHHTFDAPTWTAGLDYQIDPQTLVYAKGSRGFKAGGFNGAGGTSFPQRYKSEYVTDVEVGMKSDWDIDGVKLRTNVDVFHDDYLNAQRAVGIEFELLQGQPSTLTSTTAIANGNATIEGLEFEGTVVPFDGLNLTATWSWTDAHYDYFFVPTIGNRTALPYPFVPKNKFGFTADYKLPFVPDEMGDVHAIASYVHTGRIQYATGDVEPFGYEPGYGLLDLRLDWNNVAGQPVDASFFMTNVTDNVYKLGNYGVYTTLGIVSGIYGEPRMWGFQLKYRFGGPSAEPEAAPAPYTPPPAQAVAPAPRSYLVFFDFNKSDLTAQAQQIVDQAAANAGPAHVTQLTVTGHTDTVGSDAYNMRLSRRRAESVAARLEKDGIPSSEIEVVAKGKRDLLVPTADGIREPQNRRVQIVYDNGAGA